MTSNYKKVEKKPEIIILPLKEITISSLSTASINSIKKSPFDIGQRQKDVNVLKVSSENKAPVSSANIHFSFIVKSEGSGIQSRSEFAKSFYASKDQSSELLFQMGKFRGRGGNRRGRRSKSRSTGINLLKRQSLNRQTAEGEEAIITSTTSPVSSIDTEIFDTDDSIIVLATPDSQSTISEVSSSSSIIRNAVSGRGISQTDNSNQLPAPKRMRLFGSTSTATSTRSSGGNDTIDLVDDDDEDELLLAPAMKHDGDDIICLSDEDSKDLVLGTTSSNKKTTTTVNEDCEIIKVVASKMESLGTNKGRKSFRRSSGKSPIVTIRSNSRNSQKRNNNSSNSLSYSNVKLAVNRAKRRASSSNLGKISSASHGIQKKKKNNKSSSGGGGGRKGNSGSNQLANPHYSGVYRGGRGNSRRSIEFEFRTPVSMRKSKMTRPQPRRRATSPVFLLDRELGPGINPMFEARLPQLASTSRRGEIIRPPTFISTGVVQHPFSSFTGGVSQQSRKSPTFPTEPNFISVSTNENRTIGSLRPIIIDGSNVAMGHKGNRIFSCRGIQICAEFFKRRGHEVVASVPQFRRKHSESTNTEILDELEKEGIIKFTPSREVGGHRITPYDDRFIIEYAHEKQGIIISNDNFKDIYDEREEWRDTIRYRILPFTWMDEGCIMFPRDPMGRGGPDLDSFLRF